MGGLEVNLRKVCLVDLCEFPRFLGGGEERVLMRCLIT